MVFCWVVEMLFWEEFDEAACIPKEHIISVRIRL